MPAAAAYNVGEMAVFWITTVLRQQPNLERSPLICDKEWEELYSEADVVLSIDGILDEKLMEMLNDRKQSVFQLKVSLYLEPLCLDILYNICSTYTILTQIILNVHVYIRTYVGQSIVMFV